MGPGSSKAELEREYLRGLGAAISRATEWREACVEARDERDVALRRVAELERRVVQLELQVQERHEAVCRALDGQWSLTP